MGRSVDHDDLICALKKLARHALSGPFAGYRGHFFLKLFDVLKVHACDNGDARSQQFFDVATALAVARTRGIVVSEPIDDHDLGPPFDDTQNIDDILASDLERRNDFEVGENPFHLKGGLRLNCADHNVFATLT